MRIRLHVLIIAHDRRMSSWNNVRCTTWSGTPWWPSCECSHIRKRAPLTSRAHGSLRHVEYYRGILFLTTNRVRTFDEAFLSRIHVALHFTELSKPAKAQVWRAFLMKVGVEVGATASGVTEDDLQRLAERDINGRQIKNATRTANSLAVSRSEKLAFAHLSETLDAMDEFTAEFKSVRA